MNFEYTKATDLIFKSQVNPLTGQPFSNRYYSILEDRKKLPVMEFLDTLEEAVEKNQVVIGRRDGIWKDHADSAGGWFRRVCDSVGADAPLPGDASRIRQDCGLHAAASCCRVECGEACCGRNGRGVRTGGRLHNPFRGLTTERTKLKYRTGGMLQRETTSDPMLSRYAIILLDEAHECLLSNQSILDLLKKILPQRPDLKLVVMSPTLETSHFQVSAHSQGDLQKFFNDAPLCSIPGCASPEESQ